VESSRPARTIVFVTHDVDEASFSPIEWWCSEHVQGESSRTWMSHSQAASSPANLPAAEFQGLRKAVTDYLQGDMLQRLSPRTRWRRPRGYEHRR